MLDREAMDCLRRSIDDEWVEPGGMVPGGYMPSFRQRTRRTHGSAGSLYFELGSMLPVDEFLTMESVWWREAPLSLLETKLPSLFLGVLVDC